MVFEMLDSRCSMLIWAVVELMTRRDQARVADKLRPADSKDDAMV